MFYNNNWPNCPKCKLMSIYGFSNDSQQTWIKTNWTKGIDKSTVLIPQCITSNKEGRGSTKKRDNLDSLVIQWDLIVFCRHSKQQYTHYFQVYMEVSQGNAI